MKGNYDCGDLPIAEALPDSDQAAYDALVSKDGLMLRRLQKHPPKY